MTDQLVLKLLLVSTNIWPCIQIFAFHPFHSSLLQWFDEESGVQSSFSHHMESSQAPACWKDPVYTWYSSHKAAYDWGKPPGPKEPSTTLPRIKNKNIKVASDGVYWVYFSGISRNEDLQSDLGPSWLLRASSPVLGVWIPAAGRHFLGMGRAGKGLLWWSVFSGSSWVSHVSAPLLFFAAPGFLVDSRWIRPSRNWLCFMI